MQNEICELFFWMKKAARLFLQPVITLKHTKRNKKRS